MTVDCFLSDRGSQRVIRQSFSPLRRLESLGMRGVLTAKPTPDTQHSSAPWPLQKNVKSMFHEVTLSSEAGFVQHCHLDIICVEFLGN